MNIQALDSTQFQFMVERQDHKIITTSLKVAEFFGREHKNVMQSIKRMDCSDEFLTANFSAVKYQHRGNEYKAYEMTKNGFMFLVMSFTGKKAARIKEAYINAFDWMTEQLHLEAFTVTAELNEATRAFLHAESKASDHGRGLRQWQELKPELETKLEQLKAIAQMPLKLH